MPMIVVIDGKAMRLVAKVGNGFTTFEWVEIEPNPQQEEALEASE